MSRNCIICSQHKPKVWLPMLMEDEVSSNSMLKRGTRYYNVMSERRWLINKPVTGNDGCPLSGATCSATLPFRFELLIQA